MNSIFTVPVDALAPLFAVHSTATMLMQTMEVPVVWDAISDIMTSLYWF